MNGYRRVLTAAILGATLAISGCAATTQLNAHWVNPEAGARLPVKECRRDGYQPRHDRAPRLRRRDGCRVGRARRQGARVVQSAAGRRAGCAGSDSESGGRCRRRRDPDIAHGQRLGRGPGVARDGDGPAVRIRLARVLWLLPWHVVGRLPRPADRSTPCATCWSTPGCSTRASTPCCGRALRRRPQPARCSRRSTSSQRRSRTPWPGTR
jgi:hypothetical protein